MGSDDTKRLDALQALIDQAERKGVTIGRGCFTVISVGRGEVVCEYDLRGALDALIESQQDGFLGNPAELPDV